MMTKRRGITLMETVLGVLLVGGVLAGTLGIVGPTARSSQLAGDEVLAAQLADEMIEEINAQPYEDPQEILGLVSLETGEIGSPDRSKFDDVDDYHGWTGAVESTTGIPRSGLTGNWTRSVTVAFANDDALISVRADDGGIKKITVIVRRDGVQLAKRQMIRTKGADTSKETD